MEFYSANVTQRHLAFVPACPLLCSLRGGGCPHLREMLRALSNGPAFSQLCEAPLGLILAGELIQDMPERIPVEMEERHPMSQPSRSAAAAWNTQ